MDFIIDSNYHISLEILSGFSEVNSYECADE